MDASRLLQLQTAVAHQRSPSRNTPQNIHFQTDCKALFGSPIDSHSPSTSSVTRSNSCASSADLPSSSDTRPSPGSTSSSYSSSSSSSSGHHHYYSSSSSAYSPSHPEDAIVPPPAAAATAYTIVRCSRCQRTASLSSSNPQNQMIPFGLNVYYCHRCASLVGYI